MSLGRGRDRSRGRGGGAGSFAPTQVAGLGLWYDAILQSGYADGANMPSVTDFSGNARTGTGSATNPVYRTAQLNSRPCFQFGGASSFASPAFATTSHSIFVVGSFSAGGAVWDRTDGLNEDGYSYLTNGGPSVYVKRGAVQEGWDFAAGWGLGSVPFVFCDEYTGTHAAHNGYYNSVTARGDRTGGFANDPGTASSGALATGVGARAGGGLPSTGVLGAILVYTSAVSAADRNAILRYLGTRWGIAIS